MRPEDVDAEWVEKAARHRFGRHLGHYPEITWESVAESIRAKYLASAADYLAAVTPDIQAQAWDEGQASGLREGNLMRAYGEARPGLNPYRAARLTATTEESRDV